MSFTHVRAGTPSGEHVEAWRCAQPGCGRLRFGNIAPRYCKHFVEPKPPVPRA